MQMSQNHNFAQKVIHGKDSPVSIILYDENQILDLKRFCMSGRTVMGIDKTYNLGKIFATVATFKNLSLNSVKSND